jgi:hypothetical protein
MITVTEGQFDLFLGRLRELVGKLEDDELVGAYNLVRWLPAELDGDSEAWGVVDAELTKRGIKFPGTSTRSVHDVVRAPRCKGCDAEAALIYDTCGHGS